MLKYIKVKLLLVKLDQISLIVVFSAHFVAHLKVQFFLMKSKGHLCIIIKACDSL